MSTPQRLFSPVYLVVSLSLSLITLGIVFYYTFSAESLQHLAWKRMHGLVLAWLISLAKIWFWAKRLELLSMGKLTLVQALRVTLMWDFTSAISPSSVGGAPVGMMAMRMEGLSLGRTTGITLYTVFLDQILYVIVVPLIVLANIWYDIVPEQAGALGETIMVLMYLILISYAGLLTYGVLVKPTIISKVIYKVFSWPFLSRFRASVENELGNLERTAIELKHKPRSFVVKAAWFTLLSWLAKVSVVSIVVLSFMPADVLLSVVRSMAMTIAGMFVPTPGGSGGMEALFVLFQGPLITRAGFIGISILMWRFLTFYLTIALGIWVTSWYLQHAINTSESSK